MVPIDPHSTDKAMSLFELINKSLDLRGKLQPLSKDEDRVRRFVLEHFPKAGKAPTKDEIGIETRLSSEELSKILETLDSRDIIYLKDGEISGAYPFSNTATNFKVTFPNGQTAFAMCAIDALGISFMVGKDVKIESTCAYCGEDLVIEIVKGEVTRSEPEDVSVFAGFECGKHAATTLCTTLVLLHDEHIKYFEEEQKGKEHEILTLGEALFVGKRIFEDTLKW